SDLLVLHRQAHVVVLRAVNASALQQEEEARRADGCASQRHGDDATDPEPDSARADPSHDIAAVVGQRELAGFDNPVAVEVERLTLATIDDLVAGGRADGARGGDAAEPRPIVHHGELPGDLE